MLNKNERPSYLNFDPSAYAWSHDINYQQHPELYKVGKGEQGVLICEPYKSAIGRHWRFKNERVARQSAIVIYKMFLDYLQREDFVGADIARKYLQMGFTRARRYANYRGGRKYDKENNYALHLRGTGEQEKAVAADVFFRYWQKAERHPLYATMKLIWKAAFG